MRNIFLSFLGTNSYIRCNYYPEHEPNHSVDNVSYVQQALVQLYCQHFTATDRIVVFTTQEAKQKNWLDHHQFNPQTKANDIPNQGLESVLGGMNLRATFGQVDIADGFSEAEIWSIFEAVYQVLEEGDRVIFDITHAFRSLPMLGMSLIHYAKAMKNIEVAGVYYGAFEKLGPAFKVKELPVEERNAPILNLKAFSDLQDWTSAAQDFVQYGISKRWQQLTQAEVGPLLASSQGKDLQARNLNDVARGIDKLTSTIKANRGREIVSIPQSAVPDSLSDALKTNTLIPPLRPILETVHQKVSPLVEAGELSWLAAVGWCIDHQMVQQGITQLQEGLLTWFCQQLAAENNPHSGFFDWKKEAPRNILSAVLSLCKLKQRPKEEEWGGDLAAHPDVGHFLFGHKMVLAWAPRYNSLTQLRNDINHGGYTDSLKASNFAKKLEEHHQAVKEAMVT